MSGATMGTYWRARVVENDAVRRHEAETLIREALALVVDCMSPWEPASDLARHREAPADSWVPFREPTLTVLRRALEVAALTRGAYDPTIGRLTDALGFGPGGTEGAVHPASRAALVARSFTGHARVRIDGEKGAVYQPGGYALDLCSIAKGHAVDLAVERLVAAGACDCFLEIGGEARGVGCKPDGNPWWCAIEPPRNAAADFPVTVAAVCELALATSGNALRKRSLPDGELGHIVNPLPGCTVPLELESVTVLAPSCMEADVFATALFLMGPEEGIRLAETQGLAALFVERCATGGHAERWTRGFAEYLG